jgi:putative ABC transport system permease protein
VAGVALATAAFTVLTGASRTSRLEVRGEVSRQFRTAYDVLVRPPGARLPLERRAGLIQSTAVSSAPGGISMAQLREVRDVPGVEVAAPLAMFGQVVQTVPVKVPLARPAGRRSLFRSEVRWTADAGMTRIDDPPSYVYVTPRPLDGFYVAVPRPGEVALAAETLRDGRRVPVCPYEQLPDDAENAFSPSVRSKVDCWSTRTGLAGGGDYAPNAVSKLGARANFAIAMPLAGIDPVAEEQLSGIRRSTTSGRFLTGSDRPRVNKKFGIGRMRIPVVLSDQLPSAVSARVRVTRLPYALAARIPAIDDSRRLRRALAAAPGSGARVTTVDARAAYAQFRHTLADTKADITEFFALWRTGTVRYRRLGERHVAAVPTANRGEEWAAPYTVGNTAGFLNAPATSGDVGFRSLRQRLLDLSNPNHPLVTLRAVGTYAPGRAAASKQLLAPFTVPVIRGADARSRALLHGGALPPNGDPAGLIGLPPMMLTTLAARSVLYNDTFLRGSGGDGAAPVSSIRVRVAGVHGADPASRERIRLVADRIRQRTGLAVDITAGASPTSVQVDVPSGRFGRPTLSLSDPWVLKGVATTILNAVDRKSVVLFCLVLLVCGLFCLSAMAAAVRQRTADLAVLACVGWPRAALLRLLLGEILLLGTIAGLLGLAVAVPAGAIFDLSITAGRAALAVPAAAVLSVLAALGPVLRATRASPLDAVRPPARAPRRQGGAVSVLRMAVANTLAVPGRSVLGALGLAVGILALTMLLAVTLAFRGAVVGSVLGDAVSVQVRTIDYVSVAITLALGILGLADVLYLNVRDRGAELASLRATGWPEHALNRMIALEGLVTGTIGGLAGACVGLLGAHWFTGLGVSTLLLPTALGVAIGAACAALSAVAPVLSLRRLPTARLLAEE